MKIAKKFMTLALAAALGVGCATVGVGAAPSNTSDLAAVAPSRTSETTVDSEHSSIYEVVKELEKTQGFADLQSEFTNLITIAEMTPGPIAVNSATFVGMQIAGILGAIIATLGCILPSCIIVTLLAYVYMKYRNMSLLQGTLASLRPAVVSMIAKAGVTILISAFFIDGTVNLIRQNVCVEMIIFFVIALVLLRKFKINPILAMVLCGVANVVLSAVKKA